MNGNGKAAPHGNGGAAPNGNGPGNGHAANGGHAAKAARPPAMPRMLRPRRPDDVDAYTSYLERQFGELAGAIRAVCDGNFAVRLPTSGGDEVLAPVTWAFNELVQRTDSVVREVGRVCRAVGREGQTAERAVSGGAAGAWASSLEQVNDMVGEVAWRTKEVARIVNDVSEGDLSHKMALEYEGRPLQGDHLRVGLIINQLVDRLRLVSSEVTRVAREVGTEGKLGGQAEVKGVSGTWKDLTDNVNLLAGNLTTQVRNMRS